MSDIVLPRSRSALLQRVTFAAIVLTIAVAATASAAQRSALADPAVARSDAVRLDVPARPAPTPQARATAAMVDAVNAVRSARGLPIYHWDDRVAAAAQAHADDMASRNRMGHDGSDGSDAGERLTRHGFIWFGWGENLAAGFVDPVKAVEVWMASSGHRANLLGDFTTIGIGVTESPDGVMFWVLDVAT